MRTCEPVPEDQSFNVGRGNHAVSYFFLLKDLFTRLIRATLTRTTLTFPPKTHTNIMACICALNVVAKAATTGSVKIQPGKKYADIKEAVKAGAVAGCAPFPEGVDAFGFFNGIEAREAQRYADVEITHGRIAMLASLGFLVGEQVEGSSFLFDSQVTGPAINHFQQVPGLFWGLLGAFVFTVEANRVQAAWQDPFVADRLFLQKADHIPGDYGFDPLGLGDGISEEDLARHRMGELNNGRLAMIAISGMFGQELVNGLNLLPADDVMGLGFRLPGAQAGFAKLEEACRDAPNEAECAKAFDAAERGGAVMGSLLTSLIHTQ